MEIRRISLILLLAAAVRCSAGVSSANGKIEQTSHSGVGSSEEGWADDKFVESMINFDTSGLLGNTTSVPAQLTVYNITFRKQIIDALKESLKDSHKTKLPKGCRGPEKNPEQWCQFFPVGVQPKSVVVHPKDNQVEIRLPNALDPEHTSQFMSQLMGNPHVNGVSFEATMTTDVHEEKVEEVAITPPSTTSVRPKVTPNDPFFPQQIYMQTVRAPEAWGLLRRRRFRPIVAMLGTGIDYTHQDLAMNMWTTTVGGVPYLASDGHGFDYVGGPMYSSSDISDIGSGTGLAGIIAAIGNNKIDGAGVDWMARLMVMRVANKAETVTIGRVTNALSTAILMKADISFVPFQFTSDSQSMRTIFSDPRMLYVTSMSAEEVAGCNKALFPAAYGLPNVLVVTEATSAIDAPLPNCLANISAPGDKMLTTAPYNQMKSLRGSATAAALVAGAASLIKSQCWDMDAAEVAATIIRYSTPSPGRVAFLDIACIMANLVC